MVAAFVPTHVDVVSMVAAATDEEEEGLGGAAVIIFSLITYVNPWNEVPTNIRHAPENTFAPMADESMAVNDNPNTTKPIPIHCGFDRDLESKILEYNAAHMVTEEYIMEKIVGPAMLFPAKEVEIGMN